VGVVHVAAHGVGDLLALEQVDGRGHGDIVAWGGGVALTEARPRARTGRNRVIRYLPKLAWIQLSASTGSGSCQSQSWS
jgi:hypothetical protein